MDALLRALLADPTDESGWLVLADWLEENRQASRAELPQAAQQMSRGEPVIPTIHL